MDIRPLTADYAVSPQIDPADLSAIAAAGYTTIINNRPCFEIPPSHRADVMGDAAQRAGLDYKILPVSHETLTMEIVAQQRDMIASASGPVLAYCASGTRCTIVWALGQAGLMPVEEIIATAAQQGYDMRGIQGQLEMLSSTPPA